MRPSYIQTVFVLAAGFALAAGSCRSAEQPSTKIAKPATPSPVHRAAPVDKLTGFAQEVDLAYPREAPKTTGSRSYRLTAAPTSVRQLDGRMLNVWAYNGQVPGPILRVRLGEELVVTLRNDLPQPTTIHWHGVRVPNAMDGVPGVTQKAIEPGASFTYRFVPKDAGTFWFHPHVRGAEQVERGLYGVLIVDDAAPLPYSRDEAWVLDDWRLGSDGQIDPRFVTRHDLAHDGRWGQVITVNGESGRTMTVQPGQRLRLRLVNVSNARAYTPDFGELPVRVVAVDGMYVAKPYKLSGQELAPGNRLDLDIVVPTTASGLSFPVIDRFTRRPFTLATISVVGDKVVTPDFPPPNNPRIPVWKGALDEPVGVTYALNAGRGGKHGIEWTINGQVWGDHQVTELVGGRWIRMRFRNDSSRLHPMHLHGQFFKVIERNGRPAREAFLRDTVLVRGRETVDIALVPVDWGRWIMHCHILEHADAGMMTELEVKP